MSETANLRSINIVNFLRGVEPRGPVDLLLPAQKQMEELVKRRLPATWLLQYDALVAGPFVDFLKHHMPKGHEVGTWFELNELHCRAAGVEWRGRPGYEWDHFPDVAFTIGYSPEERIKLADTAMQEFEKVWGAPPKSVASWNLDAITMAQLSEHHGVEAFAVCRDQIATDGFTIWGAPFAGYFPSKVNCWSPALDSRNQISAPVFKMLGQDPVYYYESTYPMPDGKRGSGPDTMEPVWPSGRSAAFIRNFLNMIAKAPSLAFAYAQLGQENNFGWPEMADGYPRQMDAVAGLPGVQVETMGATGRRFRRAFKATPAQAQVMAVDPFDNTARVERTVWYQSRWYRANLHLKGDLPYLRDLTVYSDHNPQPFLREATRLRDVEQRMPAVLDGYHWSATPGSSEPGAAAFFVADGERLRLAGDPVIHEEGAALRVELPVSDRRTLRLHFEERTLSLDLDRGDVVLSFEWDPSRAALQSVDEHRADYRWQGFDYRVEVSGKAHRTASGWEVAGDKGGIVLTLAQPA